MRHSPADQAAYLKQLLESTPDGVFTIDTELEIQYVNPAFCDLLGYAPEELIGTAITDHLGDLDILDACMAEVDKTGCCNHQETIFRRRDGSMVHISKNVQAMCDEEGNFREILVTIRDMTALHTLNKELAASKRKLEDYARDLERVVIERGEANRALQETLAELRATQKQLVESEKLASLGSLVAGVSHEINTPLGVVVTAASAMREELNGLRQAVEEGALKRSRLTRFIEQAQDSCRILASNVERATNLVNSFKRIAVDQASDEWRDVNLYDYCESVLTSLGPSLPKQRIRIDNRIPPELSVHTHPGALYQILSNLIMNSLIHAYDDSERGCLEITAEEGPDGLALGYCDDGRGIEAGDLDKIYEPFFTTRRGQGGSGLGLSIVYNLVTGTLRGRIEAESTPGEGTCFRITLPGAEASPAATRERA